MEPNLADRLRSVANRQTLALTHYGRKTGKAYCVTIWFLIEDARLYLATADMRRNWTRNVLVNPKVSLKVGSETFEGTVRQLTNEKEREHVIRLVQAKYWWATPFIVSARMLQAMGLLTDHTGAFEVKLNGASEQATTPPPL
jgi:deazaflavin-dependent oxidoreductase (nitroreductase family)